MARLEPYSSIQLNEDITLNTEVSGNEGKLYVDNGYNTHVPSFDRIGRGTFDVKFNLETETLPDNSIRYRLTQMRFSDYVYHQISNKYDLNYHVNIDAIKENQGLQRIWELDVNGKRTGDFVRPVDYRPEVIYTGIIHPNKDRNARSEAIPILRYSNDALGSSLDDLATFGVYIINDLPPTISPKAWYDCVTGKWTTTNREGGYIKRKNCDDGSWSDIRTIDPHTAPVKLGTGIYDCSQDKFVNQDRIGEA